MCCPRCGTPMSGGVCPECGFPVTACRLIHSFDITKTPIPINGGKFELRIFFFPL